MRNFLIVLLLLYFFKDSSCLFSKKSKSQTLLQTKGYSSAGNYNYFVNKYQDYGKIALDEINKYRKLHFFLKGMQWRNDLADQAEKEAKEVIYKNNFGDHDKFDEYQSASNLDYFTEIAVKISLNDHNRLTKRTVAQYILSALTKEYKTYIAQDYSYAGIAVQQIIYNYFNRVPNNEPNEYIVILHLAQKANKWSCKKALQSGHMAKSITVTNKGKQEVLECDQVTDGGGWTLIADENQYARGTPLVVPIDDRGLDYDEILFEAKPYFYFNYVSGSKNVWTFDQYNFRQCGLRFGDSWYVDYRHQGYNVKYYTYDQYQDVTILQQGKECFWHVQNYLWMCASKFILTSIPKGERLNAFSEMEAAAKVAYEDNIYRFYFKLFVR